MKNGQWLDYGLTVTVSSDYAEQDLHDTMGVIRELGVSKHDSSPFIITIVFSNEVKNSLKSENKHFF